MKRVEFLPRHGRTCVGLKGPRGAEWLTTHGLVLPAEPNTFTEFEGTLVARLGATEFFIEDAALSSTTVRLRQALAAGIGGVYPVLREEAGFELRGAAVNDVLVQVCNVNFAEVPAASRSVFMTQMVGVSVLIVPAGTVQERAYRIWCDPTFGAYLGETLGTVVNDCGGNN